MIGSTISGRQSQQSGTDADDVLYVGKGNELIDGKAGNDVLNLEYDSFASSSLQFDSTKGLWTMSGRSAWLGSDLTELVGVESIQFRGIKLDLNEQTKRLVTDSNYSGSNDNDMLYMSAATEVIDGKGGVDKLDLSSYNSYDANNTNISKYTSSGLTFDSGKGHWMVNHFVAGKPAVELIDVETIKFGDIEVNLNDPSLRQVTQHVSTSGDDNLIGNDLGYELYGGKGDDVFTGNGGDDTFSGGMGKDVAVYRGSSSDYVVERNGTTGMTTIQDLNTNRDGTDTLWSVDRLRFADGEFDLSALATIKPGTELPPPAYFGGPIGVGVMPDTYIDVIVDYGNYIAMPYITLGLVGDVSFQTESQAFGLF